MNERATWLDAFLGAPGYDEPNVIKQKTNLLFAGSVALISYELLFTWQTMSVAVKYDFPGGLMLFVTACLGVLLAFSIAAGVYVRALLITHVVISLLFLGEHLFRMANHVFLHYWLIAAGVLFYNRKNNSDARLLQISRWLLILLFFWTGLRKLMSGAWFEAEFIALSAARGDGRFESLLSLLGFEAELTQFSEWGGRVGTGPYQVHNPIMFFVSNAVWIGELFLPWLLCFARTRKFGLIAIAVMIVAIELVAFEMVFGLLILHLLLQFRPAGAVRWRWLYLIGLLALEHFALSTLHEAALAEKASPLDVTASAWGALGADG